MVGPDRSKAGVRSQTQISPPGAEVAFLAYTIHVEARPAIGDGGL